MCRGQEQVPVLQRHSYLHSASPRLSIQMRLIQQCQLRPSAHYYSALQKHKNKIVRLSREYQLGLNTFQREGCEGHMREIESTVRTFQARRHGHLAAQIQLDAQLVGLTTKIFGDLVGIAQQTKRNLLRVNQEEDVQGELPQSQAQEYSELFRHKMQRRKQHQRQETAIRIDHFSALLSLSLAQNEAGPMTLQQYGEKVQYFLGISEQLTCKATFPLRMDEGQTPHGYYLFQAMVLCLNRYASSVAALTNAYASSMLDQILGPLVDSLSKVICLLDGTELYRRD